MSLSTHELRMKGFSDCLELVEGNLWFDWVHTV